MKIGILQTGEAPEALRDQHGDYPDMFARLLAPHGFEFATWNVSAMAFPARPSEADGWLITGSRHGVYEDHAFIAPLEQFIRDVFAADLPLVGICFGHQIMAQALGGLVAKFEGGWAVGTQIYDFGGRQLALNAWHQDQVLRPPARAEVLARNEHCAYAALGYGSQGLSVQAHPEFDDCFIEGLIEKRGRGLVPDDLLAGARERMGQARDADQIAAMIADHFKSYARKPAPSEAP